MRTSAAALAVLAIGALAQDPPASSGDALINKRYPWPYAGPYKVDTLDGARGIMTGINRCNSSTATQDSMCVNTVVNNITDFCIYAPPQPNSVIGNVEGECVAWCNTNKYGTRVIPDGAITGMVMVKTPGYLAMGMNINGPLLNVQAGDPGGELDPHGADRRGNPIGSLVYSNAFDSNKDSETQIYEWHEFIGGSRICMKVCDPSHGDVQGNENLCDNSHDTVGCNVNVPLDYGAIGTTFQYCLGENQLPPASNLGGSVFTPASSSCTSFASSDIFSAAPKTSSATNSTTSVPTTSTSAQASTATGSDTTGAASPAHVSVQALLLALALACTAALA